MKPSKRELETLSRERWLEMALDIMTTHCVSKFTLDSLLKKMPVGKGSFYFHFTDRAEFLESLAKFWFRRTTEEMIPRLAEMQKSHPPERQLWELMCTVQDMSLVRWELLIRSLALEFPVVDQVVRKCDEVRNGEIKRIFAEMGFADEELEMRTYTFNLAVSMQGLVKLDFKESEFKKMLVLQHKLFTRT